MIAAVQFPLCISAEEWSALRAGNAGLAHSSARLTLCHVPYLPASVIHFRMNLAPCSKWCSSSTLGTVASDTHRSGQVSLWRLYLDNM